MKENRSAYLEMLCNLWPNNTMGHPASYWFHNPEKRRKKKLKDYKPCPSTYSGVLETYGISPSNCVHALYNRMSQQPQSAV